MFAKQVADSKTKVRAGVGVIIEDEEKKILLEKRSDCGLWGLPGGRIEPGESIVETAKREVREETGLTVEITELLGVYSGPQERIVTYPDNVVQLVDIILRATILSGMLSCSDESEALQFFHLNMLPSNIVPPARKPLEDFVQGLTGVMR